MTLDGLRTELRTMRSLPAMVLFAITTFIIFRYGLDRTTLSGSLAGGVLWTTILFAAILGINRIFVSEREEGGFDALITAGEVSYPPPRPPDPSSRPMSSGIR